MGCKNHVNGYYNGTMFRYHAPNCGCGEGRAHQGHPHAELMAQYALVAKTNPEPWREFEFYGECSMGWIECKGPMNFNPRGRYRRKPKTKLIHGVEVPDISFMPKDGVNYYRPDISDISLFKADCFCLRFDGVVRMSYMGLCYPYTEEGKQAAILHAKAMLAIA